MSLLEKATLITTPTAHSNGTLHSIKGGTVADFDVVRGSAATRVNAEGIIESVATNIPRIDYTTGEGVVLLEPQSTNLLPQSEDLSTGWGVGNSSVVADSAISPDGTLNAFKLVENTATSSHNTYFNTPNTPTTNGVTYTMSFFAKAAERTRVRNTNAAESLQDVIYDLSSGTIVSEGANIIDSDIIDYGNGWYRCIMSFVSTTTIAQTNVGLIDGISNTYLGDGVSGAYIWGFQTEALPYATSYIPTSGAIATRLADSVTGAGDATTFNDSEGVLYAEMAALANDGTTREISINNGSIFNRVSIYYTASVIYAKWQGANGGIDLFHIISEVTDFHKVAIKYKSGDTALWVDGLEVDTSSSVNSTSGINVLDFDRAVGANKFYGKVKALAVFNEALTDSELECLTTI